MNVKIAIQFLIFITLLVFLFFFINKTFLTDNQSVVDLSSNINLSPDNNIEAESIDANQNVGNIIENLNYRSLDGNGNEYILNADFGETSSQNEDIIILKNVTGVIKLSNKSDIEINSDFAKYNSKNFDTYFYQNVIGNFKDNKIYCDNLDLLIKDNLAVLYNNINFLNYNLMASADQISLNLLSGDVSIKMFDKKNKVQIIKKMN